MRNWIIALAGTIALALVVSAATAYPPGSGDWGPGEGWGPGGGPGPRGPGREFRPPHPPPPLILAIDADRDGELSTTEIDNAAAAIKKLDRDGNGKVTREELRPCRGGPDARGGPRQPQGPKDFRGPGRRGGEDFRKPHRGDFGAGGGSRDNRADGQRFVKLLMSLDTNADGVIDKDEAQQAAQRFQRRGGSPHRDHRGKGPGGPGGRHHGPPDASPPPEEPQAMPPAEETQR